MDSWWTQKLWAAGLLIVSTACASTGSEGAHVAEPIVVKTREGSPRPLPQVRVSSVEEEDAPGFVAWCASGGAPIVGLPVVDEQERAYVATADGYLHAFERDGRFRWSYTVIGTPLGSVSLRPSDGAILMGTTGRYIYAVNQDGSLRFRYPTLTPVWSGLLSLNPSTVVFLGHDTRVYALSNHGRRRYRVRAPSAPMGEPVIAPNDVVWLPLEDGVARFEAAFKLDRFPFQGPVEEIVVLGDDIIARSEGQAFHVTAQGETSRLGPARLLAGDGKRALLISQEGKVELLEPGLQRHTVELEGADIASVSAPPALVGEDLWLPHSDGTVSLYDLKSGRGVSLQVGDRPLSKPVVGSSGKWAVVSEPGGEFCAVQISRHPSER